MQILSGRWLSIITCLVLLNVFVRGRRNQKRNLLRNPSFNVTDGESGFVASWSCQGERTEFIPMTQTRKSSKSKPFAGLCTQRTSFLQGPSADIYPTVVGDGMYRVKGWTKLLNGETMEEYASIELWLRWKSKEKNAEEDSKMLGARNKFLQNRKWVYWNTQFHLAPYTTFEYVVLYFRGPPVHVDIMIDEMVLEDIPKLFDWQENFNDRIENVRMRDVVLKIEFPPNEFNEVELITSATLKVTQITSKFGFGASVHYEAIKHNERYRNFIQNNFEWTTMEHALKWPYMEKVEGEVNYSRTDDMLKILQDEMRMKVRGHCIFWAVQEEQPPWLWKAKPVEMKGAIRKRLYDVLNRYKHRIHNWDINNEMLHGSFYSDAINVTIRDWMYYEAHKIHPSGEMFVNEYEVLSAPWMTQSYIEQIRHFQERGVRIDGIGVQGHFSGHVHPEILKERLDSLAVLGLPIWITELDAVVDNDSKRADAIDKIMRTTFAHPAVHGIVLWTFWDKHAWKKNTSLFHGHQFTPNLAGQKYLELRREWKTELSDLRPVDVSHHNCVFQFRAFHGLQAIKVTLPDGSVVSKNVEITDNPGELVVVFNTHRLKDILANLMLES